MTKEQIERARQVKVLDYVLMYEPDSVRRVGSGYRSKEHESLAISDKGFYWHSRGFGGKTYGSDNKMVRWEEKTPKRLEKTSISVYNTYHK